jgi:hypothetical protein
VHLEKQVLATTPDRPMGQFVPPPEARSPGLSIQPSYTLQLGSAGPVANLQETIEVDSVSYVPIEDDELAALRREIRHLQARLAELEESTSADQPPKPVDKTALGASPSGPSPSLASQERSGREFDALSPRSDRRPVRAVVLDVLEDTGIPTYSREISQLVTAMYGRSVSSTRFGALSADEQRMHVSSRPRSVYLGHALTAERFEPIKRLWIRSDWPLIERVLAPTTSRTRHLRMTVQLCDLAEAYAERAADPVMLKILAADHAADLPGVQVRRGKFPLTEWRAVATELLAELGPRDADSRAEAAQRLAELAEQHQLFGPPQIVAVTDEEPRATGLGYGTTR